MSTLFDRESAMLLGVYEADHLTFFQTLKEMERFSEFGEDIRDVFERRNRYRKTSNPACRPRRAA